MTTFHLSGYPRIGGKRELKFATESFWKGATSEAELQNVAADIRRAALASLEEADGVEVDYVALVAPDSFEDLADAGLGLPRSEPMGKAEGEGLPATGLLAVAARVGTTRLIDNTLIDLHP